MADTRYITAVGILYLGREKNFSKPNVLLKFFFFVNMAEVMCFCPSISHYTDKLFRNKMILFHEYIRVKIIFAITQNEKTNRKFRNVTLQIFITHYFFCLMKLSFEFNWFKIIKIHSNLDITNKSVRPFLFTISNNSLYQI